MEYRFRNSEQQKAFDEWWQNDALYHFPASTAKLDDNALWVIKLAYQTGIEKMARVVSESMGLATTTEVNARKAK